MAYELEEPLAALTSSSARHSATDLELWNADSRVCGSVYDSLWEGMLNRVLMGMLSKGHIAVWEQEHPATASSACTALFPICAMTAHPTCHTQHTSCLRPPSQIESSVHSLPSQPFPPCFLSPTTHQPRYGKTYTNGQQRNRLVDTPQRRHIHGLTTDGTRRADTGRVFAGTSVDDGVDENLDGVLLGDEVDDFERVLDDTDSHELFAVVATVHHQAVVLVLIKIWVGPMQATDP